MTPRRPCRLLAAAAIAMASLLAGAAAGTAEQSGVWPDIRAELFQDRPIEDGSAVIAIEAPVRAYDAAIVPVTVTAAFPQTAERYIKTVHLVVDMNPAPVVGAFHFTPESGSATFSTRIRINEYTDVRAIAETSDGTLYMTSRFVKAAGGCSAPALKDQEKALANIGRMKLKLADDVVLDRPNEAQLLISHPNYSGMQFDQISRNYVPADFVQRIDVTLDGRPVLSIEANISMSEDPSIHFSYLPRRAGALQVHVEDSEGRSFSESWPVTPAPSS